MQGLRPHRPGKSGRSGRGTTAGKETSLRGQPETDKGEGSRTEAAGKTAAKQHNIHV